MVDDFRAVLVELVKADARFLVVGAHALGVHGVPRATVDLVSGVAFDEAWGERVEDHFGDIRVPFIGRAAFIRNKRERGRRKDLADLEALGEDA